MGKFALLGQAARLLGQVLNHVSADSEPDANICAQLERTLQCMLAVAKDFQYPDNDQL
jgi:hypothetical protein